MIKEKLEKGDFVIGPFVKARSMALVEVMGYAGFDFLILDMEHSPFSIETVEMMIRAAEIGNIFPVVRVPEVTEPAILEPLDVGAQGILIPHVDTKEIAEKVVHFSKFAPEGERGIDIYVRSAKYSHIPKKDYFKEANRKLLIAVQIEGRKGVDNLDEILSVEGLDVIFVGPYDLSQSLGIPGEIESPLVIEEVKKIVRKVKKAKRSVGIYVDDLKIAKKWIGFGVQFIAFSVDVVIFFNSCKNIVNTLRGKK